MKMNKNTLAALFTFVSIALLTSENRGAMYDGCTRLSNNWGPGNNGYNRDQATQCLHASTCSGLCYDDNHDIYCECNK